MEFHIIAIGGSSTADTCQALKKVSSPVSTTPNTVLLTTILSLRCLAVREIIHACSMVSVSLCEHVVAGHSNKNILVSLSLSI